MLAEVNGKQERGRIAVFVRVLVEILLGMFIIGQLIVPLFRGEPLFPLFRRQREGRLLDDIDHARQDLTEDELEEILHQLRSKHESKQQPPPAA